MSNRTATLPRRPRWSSRSPSALASRVRIVAGLAALTLAAPGALLALPAAALAQGPANPLAPGIPASPAAPPTPTATTPTVINPTTTAPGGGGLSGGAAIGIAIGALALLVGISLFIWRDARRRAPVKHHAAHATAGVGARSGSKRAPKARKLSPAERRRRKRGKAR